MSFWSIAALEPKRKYRWTARVGDLQPWLCKKATKPDFELNTAEHKYINHTFKYPGRVTWSDIEVTLVDPASPDTSGALMSILGSSGYVLPMESDNTQTVSKKKAVDALSVFVLAQLDENGNENERWELKNPWISKVVFGELSYEEDDLVEITLTITYDWAEHYSAGGESSVKRTLSEVLGV